VPRQAVLPARDPLADGSTDLDAPDSEPSQVLGQAARDGCSAAYSCS